MVIDVFVYVNIHNSLVLVLSILMFCVFPVSFVYCIKFFIFSPFKILLLIARKSFANSVCGRVPARVELGDLHIFDWIRFSPSVAKGLKSLQKYFRNATV